MVTYSVFFSFQEDFRHIKVSDGSAQDILVDISVHVQNNRALKIKNRN